MNEQTQHSQVDHNKQAEDFIDDTLVELDSRIKAAANIVAKYRQLVVGLREAAKVISDTKETDTPNRIADNNGGNNEDKTNNEHEDNNFRLNAGHRILQVFLNESNKEFSAQEISEKTKVPLPTTRSTLARFSRENLLIHAERNQYKINEEEESKIRKMLE